MSALPLTLLPNLPLPGDTTRQLDGLLRELDPAGLWWLSGYAAGLAQARSAGVAPLPIAEAAPVATLATRLTIVYGSQTGNAKRVAEQLARQVEEAGLQVRLLRADAYPVRELKEERLLYIVISTQGEGDPPEDATAFVEFVQGKRAPELKQLRYAVLGLGDSSYPQFCAIGRQLDARLAELGAQRLFERGDADVDIDAVATPWLGRALEQARTVQREEQPNAGATVTPLRRAVAATWSRERPFNAELIANQRITGRGSAKDVRHVELDLTGSGLHYEPGDALGVHVANPSALVDETLQLLGLDGDAEIALGEHRTPLRTVLTEQRELTRTSRALLSALAQRSTDPSLHALLADDAAAGTWIAAHPPIEALRRWRAEWSPAELVGALRPLTPRLYSIASSSKAVGDEAHLTVDVLRYAIDARIHTGAASSHIARQQEGDRLRVYVESNDRFRLPADGARDLIMVGAGTGIAPYRAFVQQRAAAGASGRHWLLFGAQHFHTDFLYQAEWLEQRRQGRLQRLDLAFSRDQADKVYVQDRLREHGRQVFDWLERGAQFYVCGAIAMGRDVHAALRDIVIEHGGRDRDGAEDYLRGLQQAGRYAKDVY